MESAQNAKCWNENAGIKVLRFEIVIWKNAEIENV
jgi:hypothetical protein